MKTHDESLCHLYVLLTCTPHQNATTHATGKLCCRHGKGMTAGLHHAHTGLLANGTYGAADVHMLLADVSMEQEVLDRAIEDYMTALELLAGTEHVWLLSILPYFVDASGHCKPSPCTSVS